MPNLEELERQLYTPGRPEIPQSPQETPPPPPSFQPPPEPPVSLSGSSWKKLIWGLAVLVLLSLVVAIFVFWRGFYAFRKDRVVLSLDGPRNVAAGDVILWRVKIVNNNKTELRDGELVFQFPDYSQLQDDSTSLKQSFKVDELLAHQSFEKEFKAMVVGGENFERKAQAVFRFKPAAGNISFEIVATNVFHIASFPISLEINTPSETVSGESIEVSFNLNNASQAKFDNLRLRIEYPTGFKMFQASENLTDFNKVWEFREILPAETKTLTVKGSIGGIEGEGKIFRAFVERQEGSNWRIYKESGGQLKLSVSPLSLSIILADKKEIIDVGRTLTYNVSWQNNFDVPLANLTLTVKLTGELFDFNTLVSSGNFDASSQTVTWLEANVPSFGRLRPSEKGALSFQIKLKNDFPTPPGQNHTILADARLESKTKPPGLTLEKVVASQSVTAKVRGRLMLQSQVLYGEIGTNLKNSGPLPPRVGETTTFTVHWKLKSVSNSFKNVKVATVLPSGVDWTGEISAINTEPDSISYDPLGREVVWDLGTELAANSGFVSGPAAPEIVFKIRAVPIPSQVTVYLPLLSESEASGINTFILERQNTSAPEADSFLPDDPVFGGTKNKVVAQ